MIELTEKQVKLLDALVEKYPQNAHQLSERLGISTHAVAKLASVLISKKYVRPGRSGLSPIRTSKGVRVQPIPEGEEHDQLIQEFIAQNGVTKIDRGVSGDPDVGGWRKKPAKMMRKGNRANS